MSIEALISEHTAALRENTAALNALLQRDIAAVGVVVRPEVTVTGDAADGGEKPAAPGKKKTGRPAKTDVGVAPAEPPVEAPVHAAAPIGNEVTGKSDGDVPASAAVDMHHFRATVKQELLAYRDAVKDAEPASTDPGDAVKKATLAARELLTPFKAAKFDDVKDDDLAQLRGNIKAAHDALSGAAEADEFDLDV